MLNALLLAAAIVNPELPPVRAIYVNAWTFGTKKFYQLVHLAETTEINAFVIDVKDDTGYLTFRSAVPVAMEIGANLQLRARDAPERVALLRAKGIRPVPRSVVAKDPLFAARKSAWAIQDASGGVWTGRKNTRWVDAFNDSVWVYAASLAAEAARIGFEEIQYDYVRSRSPSTRSGSPPPPKTTGESASTGKTYCPTPMLSCPWCTRATTSVA